MNYCVIDAHASNYNSLAAVTVDVNRAEYCARHGYTLAVKTDGFQLGGFVHPVSWDRLAFVRERLASGKFDWAWCVGTDILITNMTLALDSLADASFHVIISSDWCAPVQADSFLVRNSPEGIGWLDRMIGCYAQYKTHVWVENQAMIDTLQDYSGVVKVLPQRRMNSYDYRLFAEKYPGEPKVKSGIDYYGHDGQWQPGDFLIHWPSLPLSVRIREATRLLSTIQR